MEISYYQLVDDVKNHTELIPKTIRVQSMNTFKAKVDELERQTLDTKLLNALATIQLLIEDAYQIDMYRFQFKIFTSMIEKELKNIEEIIFYESKA